MLCARGVFRRLTTPVFRLLRSELVRTRAVYAELDRVERLVLLAVAMVHGVGIGWGLPGSDGWDVDGVAPRDILPGILKTFTPGDYFTYPPLHLLLLAVLTLPVTLVTLARAPSLQPHDVVQTFLEVPVMTTFSIVARIISVLMSLGIVIAIGRMAGVIFGARARSWAMAIAGFEVAGAYYAHTSNLDVPALFWASQALVGLIFAIDADQPRRLRRVAVFAACAIATKDQAYAIFALSFPCALLLWAIARHRTGTLRELVRETSYLAGIGLMLVLLLDGALVNPTGFMARLRFLSGPASQDFANYARDLPGRIAAFQDAATFLPQHYPVAMVPLFAVGLLVALHRSRGRRRIQALVPALAILSFTLTFNCVARRVEERFMLPQMQLLALYGGGAIGVFLDLVTQATTSPTGRRWLPWLVRLPAAGCVAAALHQSVIMLATMLGDARYGAEAYLRQHVQPGDVIEVYGPNVYLPRFPAGARVQRVDTKSTDARNPMPNIEERQGLLGDVASRKPQWIVVSMGYAWRFLLESGAPTDRRRLPEIVKASLNDGDATHYMRALFAGKAGYKTAHLAQYIGHPPLLPPRTLHGSLAVDVWIFERQ